MTEPQASHDTETGKGKGAASPSLHSDNATHALIKYDPLDGHIASAVGTKEEKSRFEIETEKEIEAFVASLNFDDNDPLQNKFTTAEMKRAKVKAELTEQAKLSELSSFINSAFKILTSEGEKYLNHDQFKAMNTDFIAGNASLEKIDLHSPPADNFQHVLHFSDPTIESIFNVAVAKYNESQYSESLSIFILLATLVPENSDFWLRSGILAHKCENYELAIRLYNAASALDPSLAGPWIFSIDCYLQLQMQAEAEAAYAEASKICESSPDNVSWKEMLAEYHLILKKNLIV